MIIQILLILRLFCPITITILGKFYFYNGVFITISIFLGRKYFECIKISIFESIFFLMTNFFKNFIFWWPIFSITNTTCDWIVAEIRRVKKTFRIEERNKKSIYLSLRIRIASGNGVVDLFYRRKISIGLRRHQVIKYLPRK